MSGPPVRSLPLRPGDSRTLHPRAWSVGFRVLVSLRPATQVTALWLLPRRGRLPLNTSAFAGRTIDAHFEPRRLLHGQLAGPRPLEDPVHSCASWPPPEPPATSGVTRGPKARVSPSRAVVTIGTLSARQRRPEGAGSGHAGLAAGTGPDYVGTGRRGARSARKFPDPACCVPLGRPIH